MKEEIEEWRKNRAEELMKDMSYPEEPVKITDEDFDQFVNKYDRVLVDLWADWCAPCKQLEPILKQLAGDVEAAIGKLNVDENREVPSKFGVMAIPTMLIFKDGEPVDRLQGLMPGDQLRAALERA